MIPAQVAISQLAAHISHNPKVVVSILTFPICPIVPTCFAAAWISTFTSANPLHQPRLKIHPGRMV